MPGAIAAVCGIAVEVAPALSVSITDQGVSSAGAGVTTASYTIDSTGVVASHLGTLETWLLSGSAADFDVRATLNSGTSPAGTLGTWLNCGTDRTWSLTDVVADGSELICAITIEIRNATTLAVLDTAIVDIIAERVV